MATISKILHLADHGDLQMPVFQRGWVWTKKNIREFWHSLYHEYPIGSIVTWSVQSEDGRTLESVIDGQQRLTVLYSVVRGKTPPWFKESRARGSKPPDNSFFAELMFSIDKEKFDYSTKARQNNPLWVNVTELFKDPTWWWDQYDSMIIESSRRSMYPMRIHKLLNVLNRDITVSPLPNNIEADRAVEIFATINRAGTKVSEGDLVLGQLSLTWKSAREQVEKKLEQWDQNGFKMSTEWLLHAMAAIIDNRIEFDKLLSSSAIKLQESFDLVSDATDYVIDVLRDRLGIDQSMKSTVNMGLITVVIAHARRAVTDESEFQQLIGWWVYATLVQRWSSDTRNRINTDIIAITSGEGVATLLEELRRRSSVGNITSDHFAMKRTPAQSFYRLMLMLTRRCGARDLKSGLGLSFEHIGDLSSLQAHHIFPVKLLRKHGKSTREINQLANFAFITHKTNLKIGAKAPAEYLPALEKDHPGVLHSQWIPEDPRLWKVGAYPRFLEERRKLLAGAANDFLGDLLGEKL